MVSSRRSSSSDCSREASALSRLFRSATSRDASSRLSCRRWTSTFVVFCALADRATPPTSSEATTRRKARFTRFTMTPVRILSDDFRPGTWDFGCDFGARVITGAGRRASGRRSAGVKVGRSGMLESGPGRYRDVESRDGRALSPGHQPFDPADTREVVVNDGHHERDQNYESCHQHPLLQANAEIAPDKTLERHDENMATVEDGNREQVQQAKVEADLRHQGEQRHDAELRGLPGKLRHRH